MSEQELIMVTDQAGHPLFTASRNRVHAEGLWHETFHCFVVNREQRIVLLQERATEKKDFPNCLDITAAGHLLAGETVADGVRELEEELGLVRTMDQLEHVGIFLEELTLPGFIDRERTQVFLTESNQAISDYHLQATEVKRLVAFSFDAFATLGDETTTEVVSIEGERFGRNRFVPHPPEYWAMVERSIEQSSM
ncbi:NUDIX domain-containing protein [Exiguobacterium sp. ERU656]|uniref:NUDIX hydrolase n=2 Tax=unclassified Exiguobacterium TaxID=2644629 RepID=UPI001BE9B231|nr:NUDIX domain-containing protein [Exiguobacterium sp. ERU656]